MKKVSIGWLVCPAVWILSCHPLRAWDEPVLHAGDSVEVSTSALRFEPLFSGSQTDCGKLNLALSSRSISYLYRSNGLGGDISVWLKRWDQAAVVAQECNLVVLRESLVEPVQLFFAEEFASSYDLAASRLLELDHYASGNDFLTVMEQSRRRMSLVRNGVTPLSNREWIEIKRTSSRVHALQRLATLIPLSPGEVDEHRRIVPACRRRLTDPVNPRTEEDRMNDPMDPLLEIWLMAPEPGELYTLYDSLAFDWILLPVNFNADMIPALSPCTREFIIEILNRSVGAPGRVNARSLPDEQWRDPSKVSALVFSKHQLK